MEGEYAKNAATTLYAEQFWASKTLKLNADYVCSSSFSSSG